jgi:hypothetical protein
MHARHISLRRLIKPTRKRNDDSYPSLIEINQTTETKKGLV